MKEWRRELLEAECNEELVNMKIGDKNYTLYQWLALCWSWSKLYEEEGYLTRTIVENTIKTVKQQEK